MAYGPDGREREHARLVRDAQRCAIILGVDPDNVTPEAYWRAFRAALFRHGIWPIVAAVPDDDTHEEVLPIAS